MRSTEGVRENGKVEAESRNVEEDSSSLSMSGRASDCPSASPTLPEHLSLLQRSRKVLYRKLYSTGVDVATVRFALMYDDARTAARSSL